MNPLQSDILRMAARLHLGFLITDLTGKLPVYPIVQQIPLLFLWIELWKPRILFPHETVNWTVESLRDKGYLDVQPQMFFLPPGVYAHRTFNGTDWIIEAAERDEILGSANSERIATIPGGQTLVFACPREFLDSFRTARKNDEDKNFVNLFTPVGLGCNSHGHPHFSLTDAGRENANLTADDLLCVNSVGSGGGQGGDADAILKSTSEMARHFHCSDQTIRNRADDGQPIEGHVIRKVRDGLYEARPKNPKMSVSKSPKAQNVLNC